MVDHGPITSVNGFFVGGPIAVSALRTMSRHPSGQGISAVENKTVGYSHQAVAFQSIEYRTAPYETGGRMRFGRVEPAITARGATKRG